MRATRTPELRRRTLCRWFPQYEWRGSSLEDFPKCLGPYARNPSAVGCDTSRARSDQPGICDTSSGAYSIAATTGRMLQSLRGRKKSQEGGQELLQIFAFHDGVDHAVSEQELGQLKTFRELLADRLLDHARAGKGDERFGLGQNQIAQHRKGGGHAARCGVGEKRDKGHP